MQILEKQIDNLTDLGTDAVQQTIAEYTSFFIVSSACWAVFGLCVVIAAIVTLVNKKLIARYFDGEECVVSFGSVMFIVLGIVMILNQIATLTNPRAYAIHQLLKDF